MIITSRIYNENLTSEINYNSSTHYFMFHNTVPIKIRKITIPLYQTSASGTRAVGLSIIINGDSTQTYDSIESHPLDLALTDYTYTFNNLIIPANSYFRINFKNSGAGGYIRVVSSSTASERESTFFAGMVNNNVTNDTSNTSRNTSTSTPGFKMNLEVSYDENTLNYFFDEPFVYFEGTETSTSSHPYNGIAWHLDNKIMNGMPYITVPLDYAPLSPTNKAKTFIIKNGELKATNTKVKNDNNLLPTNIYILEN